MKEVIKMKKILAFIAGSILISILIGTTFAITNLGNDRSESIYHADIMLSNEQIQLWYTDEAAGVGNYTDDSVEPRGWELFPSLYWDSDGNTLFEDDESMATTIFPVVHFIYNAQEYMFCPMHQSIMNQPDDPEIIFSGWISEPNIYASEVKDHNNLLTVNSTISIYDGDNYFLQTITVKSISSSLKLEDVKLIMYHGVDVNGFFEDYAFIDGLNNNMIKAKDNTTGVWFGAYPTTYAAEFELSNWDDGPADNEDLWQHCLNNNLNGQDTPSDDVEGALKFNIQDLDPGETQSITTYYSFGHQESDLYPPAANNPPYEPTDPNPGDGATDISINADLSWTGGDPDSGDTVTYDVYFGTTSPPPKVESNQSDTTYDPGTMSYNTKYYWQIRAWDNHDASNTSDIWDFTTEEEPNNPPDPPTIDGKTSGKAGVEYEYTFTATDHEDDDVSFYVEWGDDTSTGWTEFVASETPVKLKHTWEEKDTYIIRAKAKDIHGAESDWATLEVEMPISRSSPLLLFLERLMDRFPLLERIFSFNPLSSRILNLQ